MPPHAVVRQAFQLRHPRHTLHTGKEKGFSVAFLSLSLLGGFHVERDGTPITAFESNKVRALLAYLAVEADRPHQRSALAGLLWPDHAEEAARTNLRHVLRQLRLSIDDGSAPALLLANQQTIQLDPAGAYTVDVTRFTGLLAECERCPHSSLESCAACIERYTQAAALYRGPFLAGLDIPDSEIFDEWVVMQREQLHRQALEACYTLASYHEERGDHEQARQYAWRQIELEPWREEAYRQLMRALALSGQRSAALAQFRRCRDVLAEELGVDPDPETVALYEQIRDGALAPAARPQRAADRPAGPPPAPAARGSLQDWGEAPITSYFFGRQTELATLSTWALEEGIRVIAVFSIGGMGKTTLVTKAARTLAEQFDAVFWRSLLNAPPLPEVLRSCLQLLTRQQLTDLPESLSEQLALLDSHLRQRRCLLVLDNLETILDAQQVGRYRPGYEDYGRLIEHLVQTDHRSCLMLTSRERPHGMARLEEETGRVRIMQLAGLEQQAAQALLKTRGLDDSDSRAATLVSHYSGNPLALKLVARTIQELFDSDIGAFLSDELPVFDDIRTVLDQQFMRLSELEREILIWLAIEREAASIQQLAANFVRPPSRRDLLEALRALQRRSLLEKTDAGFTLQNVVMEYVTERVVEQCCREVEYRSLNLFNSHALLKAQAAEYVRRSQIRLVLGQVAGQLVKTMGTEALAERARELLDWLRATAPLAPGYAAGNILNMLLHLGIDVSGYDFSQLCVWQAYLRGAYVPGISFANSDLTGASFTHILGQIQGLQFGPDGALLAVGLKDGMACVWDVREGVLLHTAPPRDLTNNYVCFHAESGIAAQGGPEYQIVIVDMADGSVRHTLEGHSSDLWRLVFSPDGRLAASGDGTGQVRLWDLERGRLLRTLAGHTQPIPTLAFSPEGDRLASASVDGSVCLWDVRSGRLLRSWQAHDQEVAAIAFVSEGELLATGSHDHTVRLWSTASGDLTHELRRHTEPVRAMAADQSGRYLATAGGDNFIALWDTQTGEPLHILADHGAPCFHIAVSADGRSVAALDVNDTIHQWEVESGQRLDFYRMHSNGTKAIVFSPDGRSLVSGGVDSAIYVWDVTALAAPRLTARLQGHTQRVESIVFSSDGATVASGDPGGKILLWDFRSRTSRALDTHQRRVRELAMSPDGTILASAGADGTVRLWEVRSGRPTHTLRGHTNVVNSCAFSKDGRGLATGSMDRTVRLWDVGTGMLCHTLRQHTNIVIAVDFSPDGRLAISSGFDHTVCLWDVETGALHARWPVHGAAYYSIAVHPAQPLLAAGGHDGTVRLVNLQTGQLICELHGHSQSVEQVAFHPDGRVLASASYDEAIRLWDITAEGDGASLAIVRPPRPYAGMNIAGVDGITEAQRAALKALGAVEQPEEAAVIGRGRF